MNGNYKLWRFPSVKKGKNYAVIQYSLGTPRPTDTPSNVSWSKPVKVGGKKFKNLLLLGKIDIDEFPQYNISNGGRYGSYVYFVQNNLKAQGTEVKQSIKNSSDLEKFISYDLQFYSPLSEIQKRHGGKKGFRLDLFSHAMRDVRWNGHNEKAYPLFHRTYKFVSKKKVLYEFMKRFPNPFECRNNKAYTYFWDKFIPSAGGMNVFGIERGALDSVSDIAIGSFSNIKELSSNEVQRLNYKTAVAMDDQFFNMKGFLEKTDKVHKTILPIFPHSTTSFYPKNGCMFIELMKTYKDSMDKAHIQEKRQNSIYKDFCYEKIWKIIHGEKELPNDNDDYESWGLSWEQCLKFFKYYRIEATLYSGYDGKPKCHYSP